MLGFFVVLLLLLLWGVFNLRKVTDERDTARRYQRALDATKRKDKKI